MAHAKSTGDAAQRGAEARQIGWLCAGLVAIALARAAFRYFSRTSSLQRRARDRVRAPQRPVRAPAAPAAVVLSALAHRRPDEPLRERPRLGAPAARPGRCSTLVADADALRRRDRRDALDEPDARAAGAAAVPALPADRALASAAHAPTNLAVQEGLAALSNQLAGDDLGHRGGEGLRDGGRRRAQRFEARERAALPRATRPGARRTPRCPRSRACCRPSGCGSCSCVGRQLQIAPGEMQLSATSSRSRCYDLRARPSRPSCMGWVFALVQRGAASMQRIDEVLSTRAVDRGPRGRRAGRRRCAARSSSATLTFRYPGVGPRSQRCATCRCTCRPARVLGVVGPDRLGQEHARLADPAPLRSAGRPALPRRRRRQPHPAAHAARAHRDGPAGRLPVLDDARRQRRLRAARRPTRRA